LVLVLGVTGCGEAADPADAPSRALARFVGSDASEYEQRILEDLVVTDTEYEQAVLDTLACFREKLPDLEVGDVYRRADGIGLTFDIGGPLDDARMAETDVCEDYRAAVEVVWYEQHVPTESERVARQAEFFECAQQAGITELLPGTPDIGMRVNELVLETQNRELFDCWDRFNIAFQTPFSPG
jgi:hypothetical protein